MTERLLVAALLTASAVGCGKGAKPTIPTELIQPPGPDADGGKGGKAGKALRAKHTDTGDAEGGADK